MGAENKGLGKGMDGPTPLTEPARALARALQRRGEETESECTSAPRSWPRPQADPRPAPLCLWLGPTMLQHHRARKGGGGAGPSPQIPAHRPWSQAGSHRQRLQASEALPPRTETTRMLGTSWLGWNKIYGLRGGELHSVAVVTTSNWFRGTEACPGRPVPSSQRLLCVCWGEGGSTALQGGQEVSRKRESFCAVDVEGQATKLSAGARLQAPSRLQGPGQRKWGAAAGGGPWGEEQQQI